MDYQILPIGDAWADGVFCVPRSIIKKLKLTGTDSAEITARLTVLTVAMSIDGRIEPHIIATATKMELNTVIECLNYWVSEGILTDGKSNAPATAEIETVVEKKLEKLPMPTYSPKDINALRKENKDIDDLLANAQLINGNSLSLSTLNSLINMVDYYGLNVPVVLTLYQFYTTQRNNGKSFTMHKLQKMALDWAEENVDTLEKASNKLQELEDIKDLWAKVIELCEMDYRKATATQEKMLKRWKTDFSTEMIVFATNTMKKYNDKNDWSLKEIDNILKDWKRKNFATPDDVKTYKKPEQKSNGKLKSTPSFDIDEIAKQTALNDDYDI